MWPTIVEVQDGMGLHSYGLFMLSAFCVAFLMVHYRSQKVGLQPDKLLPVYLVAAFGGLIGARLLYAFAVEPSQLIADPMSLFSASGFAFYGGVIGGGVAVSLCARVLGFPMWVLADIVAPAVVVALGIGRLGCLFAGCCHGAVAPVGDAPSALFSGGFSGGEIWLLDTFPFLATEFYGGVGRLHDVALYPTQMWSAAVGIGWGCTLAWLWRRRSFDGQIAAATLMTEPIARTVIEMFRADHRGYAIRWEVDASWAEWFPGLSQAGSDVVSTTMGLTTSQAIGMCMVVFGGSLYAARRRTGLPTVVTHTAAEDDDLLDLVDDR